MPVLTTETRLSEREAHDIMEYTRKYRTDYGIIQRYVWHVIVRRKNVINKSKLNTEIQMKPDEVLGLKAHGEFCHIRHEGAL